MNLPKHLLSRIRTLFGSWPEGFSIVLCSSMGPFIARSTVQGEKHCRHYCEGKRTDCEQSDALCVKPNRHAMKREKRGDQNTPSAGTGMDCDSFRGIIDLYLSKYVL